MRVLKVDTGVFRFVEDRVVKDVLFKIFVNDVPLIQLIVYDQYLKELAIGHLFTSNIIESMTEINEIRIDQNSALIELDNNFNIDLVHAQKNMVLEKASTGGAIPFLKENNGITVVKPETIYSLMDELNQRGEIFGSTGGTHSALIYNESMGTVFAEDVGRFNTVDKVVGLSQVRGFDLGNSIIVTSGRLAGKMVLKAALAGLPVMCSVSAPMGTGVRIAKASGMTLIGFARDQCFNVYSGLNRLDSSV
jgi:FdhD protein